MIPPAPLRGSKLYTHTQMLRHDAKTGRLTMVVVCCIACKNLDLLCTCPCFSVSLLLRCVARFSKMGFFAHGL